MSDGIWIHVLITTPIWLGAALQIFLGVVACRALRGTN